MRLAKQNFSAKIFIKFKRSAACHLARSSNGMSGALVFGTTFGSRKTASTERNMKNQIIFIAFCAIKTCWRNANGLDMYAPCSHVNEWGESNLPVENETIACRSAIDARQMQCYMQEHMQNSQQLNFICQPAFPPVTEHKTTKFTFAPKQKRDLLCILLSLWNTGSWRSQACALTDNALVETSLCGVCERLTNTMIQSNIVYDWRRWS